MHEHGTETVGAMLSRLSRASPILPDMPAAKACFAHIEPGSQSKHAFAARLPRKIDSAADGRESMAPRAM
jgi:hypothetical protein